jgi:hypothetical protein
MQPVSAAFALPRSTSICICGGGGWGGCSVCASASLRVYRVGAREEGRGRGVVAPVERFPSRRPKTCRPP